MFRHSTPIPKQEDYDHVHRAPVVLANPKVAVQEKPGCMTKLTMRENLWASWKNESFTIHNTETKQPYPLHVEGRLYNFHDRMILRDGDRNPCIVLLKTKHKHEETLEIYGMRPYIKHQEASSRKLCPDGHLEKTSSSKSIHNDASSMFLHKDASSKSLHKDSSSRSLHKEKPHHHHHHHHHHDEQEQSAHKEAQHEQKEEERHQHENQDLFLWGQVVDNELDSFTFSLHMRDGSKYTAQPCGRVMALRQYRITHNGKVCGHVAQTKYFAELRGHSWNITIGPGIDCAIMISFLIIMDEMTKY